MFDVQAVRADFPVLRRLVNGKPLVYFDNAATSQKPRQVIEALVDYYERYNSNIHRGVHTLAEESTEAYEQARRKAARFINAPAVSEIVFVRNTTEAINLVARSWGAKELRPGDEIVLTEAEHHSNLIPWQQIAAEKSAVLRFIPILDDGTLDMDAATRLIGSKTRLVSVAHMGNVLGAINPVVELSRQGGGQIDYRVFYDRSGKVAREELDYNVDGKMDTFYYYKDGVLQRVEIDSKGTGKVDIWVYLVDGTYIQRYERDTTGSGTPDVVRTFDGS